ncbi:lipopolysaccharide biosynthesis protein [Agromyces sp. SYSU K20354]|uniref:lipopolysaccharide biosynthesis protein n=1 Tax=Agromyces cavernae TaxID=2898659 RepID=UPI001E2AD060|nr:lipopolysaccharide biosynthesis protein [Agromyces cavernae]MCD2440992.1 lipopolysaccharide biosynthesis protein [Agromyces cavernae]
MSERSAESDGLGRRAIRGAAVTSAGQVLRILIQLASVVILARLLSPADFGLFAMVMSIAGIAEVFRDFGLSQAAVQAPVLTERQRSNLFWINTAIGATLAVAVFLSSWGIAALYGREELAPLAQLASVAFLLNGLTTQYRASLNRALQFRSLAITDVAAAAVGLGVGIAMGLAGTGPWALVAQLLGVSVATLALVVVFGGWLPGLPNRGVPVGGFMRFGWNMVATQMVTYVGGNVDSVVIGVRFGAAQLGIYNRAFHVVMNTANQLRAPITNVAVPILSRLQAEGARYWEFVRVGQVGLGYTIVVVLAFVIGAGVPLTDLLLGPGWAEAAPVLSLLAVAAVFQTLNSASYWVYVSKGITGPLFRYNLVSVAIKVVCILIGSQWGLIGVAIGYAVAPTVSWPISLAWISRVIEGVPTRTLAWGIVRMSLLAGWGAAFAYGAVTLTEPLAAWARVAVAALATVAAYGIAAILPVVRRDLGELRAMLRMLRRERGRLGR